MKVSVILPITLGVLFLLSAAIIVAIWRRHWCANICNGQNAGKETQRSTSKGFTTHFRRKRQSSCYVLFEKTTKFVVCDANSQECLKSSENRLMLEWVIGHGTYGKVWLASTSKGQQVAVKVSYHTVCLLLCLILICWIYGDVVVLSTTYIMILCS